MIAHWVVRFRLPVFVAANRGALSAPWSVLRAGCFVLAVAVLILIAENVPCRADSVQYFYDPAGRLTTVVDPVNGSAQYNYDAVGNILSVVRRPITDTVVAQLSPSSGPTGTVVTISGTGFGTAANTTVTFNGQAATPSAVSATQITVPVPSGAATGLVSVTSLSGTASSGTNFTVTSVTPPTISGVASSPTDQGTTITISGSGFDPQPLRNKVFINGRYGAVVTASSSVLTALVPAVASGLVSVVTPNGRATSASYLVVPPLPYLASSIGSTTQGSVGSSATSTVGTAGKIGLILFDATAGQRLAMQVTALSFGGATLALYGPDGAAIIPATGMSTGMFLDSVVLAAAGTYTVLIVPSSGSTGSATVSLMNVPPDATATIAANATPVSLTTVAGQNMSLTFAGTAGQRVALLTRVDSGLNPGCSPLAIIEPDGATQLFQSNCFNSTSSTFTDLLVLPVNGTYTIQFNPNSATAGTATFTLYTVPADLTATISASGSPVSLTTTVPGQNMSLTFSGTASQRVSLRTQVDSGLNPGCSPLTLLAPDGVTQVYSNTCANPSFSDLLVLPTAGTYTLLFNPNGTGTGTATFTLYTVPADATATIPTNGTPVAVTTTVPAQNIRLTFSGTAGQQVSLQTQVDSGLYPGCSPLTILQPDGMTQLYQNNCANPSFSGTLTLPVAGTYTILFDSNGTTTGTATFTLTTTLPDVVGTIAANGTPVSLTTTAAGQKMVLTFTGTAAQRVSLQTQVDSGLYPGCSPLTILQPDGTTQLYLNNCANPSFSDVLILPVAGTYTIHFNPNGTTVGTATFTLYNDPADASATITPGGSAVSLTTTAPGQNMGLTFAGTAGERVSLLMQLTSGLTPGCSPLTILQPNGTTQVYSNNCANYSSFFTGVMTLPVTGTYSIQLNPNALTTGTATFTLYDVPADASGSTTVGAAASNYTTTVPGQAIRVSFTGTSGQSITTNVGLVSATPSSPCYRVTTLYPDGTTVLRGDQSCSANYSSGSLTLPQSGTFTVVVAPSDVAIGTFSVGVATP